MQALALKAVKSRSVNAAIYAALWILVFLLAPILKRVGLLRAILELAVGAVVRSVRELRALRKLQRTLEQGRQPERRSGWRRNAVRCHVIRFVRLGLTAALAAGLCLNGSYLRGVVRTHHAENLDNYQFFVRTIQSGLADAVQPGDLILCNENVWDSNADAETAFFSRFTGRALHAQVLWTENPATDGDAYAYQTYRNYGGYDLAWCGRLQSADSDLMDGVQVYVQSAYVPDNAVIKYKVRLADGTEEARAICLLDCTQTPRDRNGDYLATVEDTSIVNAKLMIWDG